MPSIAGMLMSIKSCPGEATDSSVDSGAFGLRCDGLQAQPGQGCGAGGGEKGYVEIFKR